MQERWLSVDEIAAHLGVNPDTIYKWITRKRMPGHKLGRLWKFLASEVDAWVKGGHAAEDVPAAATTAVHIRAELEQLLSKPAENNGGDGEEEAKSDKPAVPEKRRKKLLDDGTWKHDHDLVETARRLAEVVGEELHQDHNLFRERFDAAAKKLGVKLSASDKKSILRAVSWRVESAPPVIATTHKPDKVEPDPLHGRFSVSLSAPGGEGRGEVARGAKTVVVEYEPDTDLRDTEQIPLLEPGGIEAFFCREVLPHVPDAWIDPDAAKIGYEVSFTRHLYQPQPLRTLDEIRADILTVEQEAEGLLDELLKGGAR